MADSGRRVIGAAAESQGEVAGNVPQPCRLHCAVAILTTPKHIERKTAMDAHVEAYYDYLDAMDWRESCAAQRAAEGAWEDAGGYGRGGY